MTNININEIEAQLVANAEQIKAALVSKRAEKERIATEIRDLVAEQKKAERLATVVRREVEKQADVAAVTPPLAAVPEPEPVAEVV